MSRRITYYILRIGRNFTELIAYQYNYKIRAKDLLSLKLIRYLNEGRIDIK